MTLKDINNDLDAKMFGIVFFNVTIDVYEQGRDKAVSLGVVIEINLYNQIMNEFND